MKYKFILWYCTEIVCFTSHNERFIERSYLTKHLTYTHKMLAK